MHCKRHFSLGSTCDLQTTLSCSSETPKRCSPVPLPWYRCGTCMVPCRRQVLPKCKESAHKLARTFIPRAPSAHSLERRSHLGRSVHVPCWRIRRQDASLRSECACLLACAVCRRAPTRACCRVAPLQLGQTQSARCCCEKASERLSSALARESRRKLKVHRSRLRASVPAPMERSSRVALERHDIAARERVCRSTACTAATHYTHVAFAWHVSLGSGFDFVFTSLGRRCPL